MGIFGFISNIFTLSPEEEAEHHQLELDYGLVEPTAAERAQMDAEDDAAYVEGMAGQGHFRDEWHTGNDEIGYTFHWREYVIDQRGHEHTRAEGERWVGHIWEFDFSQPPDVVFGEVVEDLRLEKLPVWKRLQGVHK